MTSEIDFYDLKGNDRPSNNNKFIQIRYTDILGKFHAKYYFLEDVKDFYEFIRKGVALDGSSIDGFSEINESDLLLLPDRKTICNIDQDSYNIITTIADVYHGYGLGRMQKDPRFVSQTIEEYLAKNNLVCKIGAEVECFVFDDILIDNNIQQIKIVSSEEIGTGKYPIRKKSGYDIPPFQDSMTAFRFEVANILSKFYSIKTTNINHEVASNGQIEINFLFDSPTKTADNVQIYKDVVRNIAKKNNKVANFMPKPIFDNEDATKGDNGSGMHISLSLWNKSINENNLFYDENDSYAEISQLGRYFIGGIINHTKSLISIVSPTVNSYKRLVPGYEAPVYIAWSRGNRSAVIRIPINEKNNMKSKRVEFRAPDPSANPYLATSAIIAAGIDGINKKIDPGDPIDKNIYKMSESEKKSQKIESIPANLNDAIEELKSDNDYLRICYSNELIDKYLQIKSKEIRTVVNGSKFQQFLYYYDI